MALAPQRWTFARKIAAGLTLLGLCGVMGVVMISRDLAKMDLGKVVVHKDGVGPTYEDTLSKAEN